METITPELLIVSAFGRGFEVALDARKRGWKVTLLEVSAALGPWQPEDWEGPWVVADAPELTPESRSRLLETDPCIRLDQGFVVWLRQGPPELNSSMTAFHLRAHNIPETVRRYLQPVEIPVLRGVPSRALAPPTEPPSAVAVWMMSLPRPLRQPQPLRGLERLSTEISTRSFREAWLAHLAHSWSSIVAVENMRAAEHGGPLPLLAPAFVRRLSAESIDQSLRALESSGVRVVREAQVRDIRWVGRAVDAIEIAAERRGVERLDALLWTLSALETRHFPESVRASLYTGPAPEVLWAWVRSRIRLRGNSGSRQLPMAFAMLENPDLPWTHTNFILAKRVEEPQPNLEHVHLDVWYRVPGRALGKASEIESLQTDLLGQLERRVPRSAPLCVRRPIEAERADCVRFPLLSREEHENRRTRRGANLFFASPDQWTGYDWLNQSRQVWLAAEGIERVRVRLEAERLRSGTGQA